MSTFLKALVLAVATITIGCIPPPLEMQSRPQRLLPYVKSIHLPQHPFNLEKTYTRAMHMGKYLSTCYHLDIPEIPHVTMQEDLRDFLGQYGVTQIRITGYELEHLLMLVSNNIPVVVTGKYVETVAKTSDTKLNRRSTEHLMITGYKNYTAINRDNVVLRVLSDKLRNLEYLYMELSDASAFLPPGTSADMIQALFKTYYMKNRNVTVPKVTAVPARIRKVSAQAIPGIRAPISLIPVPPPLSSDTVPAPDTQKDLYIVPEQKKWIGPAATDLELLDKLIYCYGFALDEKTLRMAYRDMNLIPAMCKFAREHDLSVYAIKNPQYPDITALISRGYAGALYAEPDSVLSPQYYKGQYIPEAEELHLWQNATAPYDGLPMGLITVVTGYNPGRVLRMYKTRLLMLRIPEHITAFSYMYILGGPEPEMRTVFATLPGNGQSLEYFRLQSIY